MSESPDLRYQDLPVPGMTPGVQRGHLHSQALDEAALEGLAGNPVAQLYAEAYAAGEAAAQWARTFVYVVWSDYGLNGADVHAVFAEDPGDTEVRRVLRDDHDLGGVTGYGGTFVTRMKVGGWEDDRSADRLVNLGRRGVG